jgi:hypothetical protein
MKTFGDDMAIAGKKLDDEDLVGYILTELDNDFDPVISMVWARVELISVSELYVQLIYHDRDKTSMARTRISGARRPSSVW